MVVGRLARRTQSPQQASEELKLLAGRIAAEHKDSNEGWSATVIAGA